MKARKSTRKIAAKLIESLTFIILVVDVELLDILGLIDIVALQFCVVLHCGQDILNGKFTVTWSIADELLIFIILLHNVRLRTRLCEPRLVRELEQTEEPSVSSATDGERFLGGGRRRRRS